MTEREKAKAIYDWCCENLKYSTVTSYLMGYYYKAAYSGYKLHYGNCYTYYAVARSLLTPRGNYEYDGSAQQHDQPALLESREDRRQLVSLRHLPTAPCLTTTAASS